MNGRCVVAGCVTITAGSISSPKVAEAVGKIPLHQLVVETDAPFQYPHSLMRQLPSGAGMPEHSTEAVVDKELPTAEECCCSPDRGPSTELQNSPALLPLILDTVCKARIEPPNTVRQACFENANAFFRK